VNENECETGAKGRSKLRAGAIAGIVVAAILAIYIAFPVVLYIPLHAIYQVAPKQAMKVFFVLMGPIYTLEDRFPACQRFIFGEFNFVDRIFDGKQRM